MEGIQLRLDNKLKEAKDFFISYLAEHPDNQQAYVELYNCYCKETSDEIISYFNALPKDASRDHKLLLAYLYLKQGDYEQAKKIETAAL